jgi:hypothetical protein
MENMHKKLLTILAVAILLFVVSNEYLSAAESSKDNWRWVLAFDVMDINHEHKADIGRGKIIVASWEADSGWDIEVFKHPITESSLNLLYNGQNWHGIQPWMVFAWTKHEGVYPDERIISYEGNKSKVRIVLKGCKTKQVGPNLYTFSQGQVDVFHSP